MSDRDAFDARLGAALRQYATGAPADVDPHAFARGIAAMAGHRHPATGVGVLRTVPAFVWVVLAAALLIAGLVGALVGGRIIRNDNLTVVPEPTETRPVGPAFACPPGTNPDEPGPLNQARPSPYFATAMAFDHRAGRLVVVTGSYGLVETWAFDVCTNTWTRMDPVREPPSFGRLVYDVDSDATIAVDGSTGHLWAYDLQANTWTEKAVVPAEVTLGAYDPVSGLVVAASPYDPTELWNYDVETDTWTPIRQANGPADIQAIAYDASVDRMVAYSGASGSEATWLLDIRTGAWSRSGAETPKINIPWGMGVGPAEMLYDEAAQRTVAFGMRLAAYDATADRWEILAEADPGGSLPLPMAYDPVNRRLVGLGQGGVADRDGVVAFDPATRTWTQLLAPNTPSADGTN